MFYPSGKCVQLRLKYGIIQAQTPFHAWVRLSIHSLFHFFFLLCIFINQPSIFPSAQEAALLLDSSWVQLSEWIETIIAYCTYQDLLEYTCF